MSNVSKLLTAVAFTVVVIASIVKSTEAKADYPDRVITMIAASAAGGPADIAARVIAERMSNALGQKVIVENVPGGGGMIGAGRVAHAKPDGYTILIHQTGIAIASSLYSKLSFNVEKDLVPVGLVNTSDSFLIGRKSLPANNWAELVALMKEKPTSFAHPGVGALGHLAGILIGQSTGTKLNLVSYRGLGPAMNDILGEHVDLLWAGAVSAVPAIKAGTVKVFAFGGAQRSPLLPDVPTLAELGFPNLKTPFWHALFAPAGTPEPILQKLNAALQEAVADPQVIKAFEKGGAEAFPKNMQSVKSSGEFVRGEIGRWEKVVGDNNIKVEQ